METENTPRKRIPVLSVDAEFLRQLIERHFSTNGYGVTSSAEVDEHAGEAEVILKFKVRPKHG